MVTIIDNKLLQAPRIQLPVKPAVLAVAPKKTTPVAPPSSTKLEAGKTYTQGQSVTDLSGNKSKVLYDATSGKLLNSNQSTTTLSSDKREDIATNNVALEKIANKGVTTNPETGVSTDASGSVYDPDEGTSKLVEADTSDEDKATENLLKSMRSSLDASTNGLIANIQTKFNQRRAEQAEINRVQSKAVNNALLMGGATGQGSSAQYAPISSSGIVQAQESYGLKQIADLDTEEQDLIIQAKAAQEQGNYRILEKKLELAEEKRKEKIDAAVALNKTIAEQNKKIREENLQMQKDTAIGDLYAQGITDVPSILSALNKGKKSGGFTAKEVAETLKNIVPPGLDDLVKTLRTNGAPQDVIQRVLSSPNINKAYENAGNWGAGGTGIIGEYNLYKAQAESMGQVPVTFQAYQDIDANRKKSIAKAGVSYGGYDSAQSKAIDQINTSVGNNPSYKKYISMQTYANNVESGLSQGSGIGDIAAINQFQKVIDEGAVTRDQDVKLIQGAQSLADSLATKINKLKKGDQLSPQQRQQMLQLTKEMLVTQKKALEGDPGVQAQKKKAERYNVDINETVIGELGGEGGVGGDLISSGQEAKRNIEGIFDTLSTDVQDLIIKSYDAGLDDIEIFKQLKSRGLI